MCLGPRTAASPSHDGGNEEESSKRVIPTSNSSTPRDCRDENTDLANDPAGLGFGTNTGAKTIQASAGPTGSRRNGKRKTAPRRRRRTSGLVTPLYSSFHFSDVHTGRAVTDGKQARRGREGSENHDRMSLSLKHTHTHTHTRHFYLFSSIRWPDWSIGSATWQIPHGQI